MQCKQNICGSFPNLNIIYGSGRNSSFVIQGTHHIECLCFFQKINLWNSSITRNKINNSSDLLISYSSITQTQIKHMLPTSFKFRVNSYIKILGEFKDENQVLEWNYNRATIHHFYVKRLSFTVFLFIQLLKIKNQAHTFYFVLIF